MICPWNEQRYEEMKSAAQDSEWNEVDARILKNVCIYCE